MMFHDLYLELEYEDGDYASLDVSPKQFLKLLPEMNENYRNSTPL